MKEIKESLGELFLGLLLGAFLLFYGSLSWGLIVDKFYLWFIEPVYFAPPISYWQAVGIGCFISLFKHNSTRAQKEDYLESKASYVLTAMILPWVVLGSGYLINLMVN